MSFPPSRRLLLQPGSITWLVCGSHAKVCYLTAQAGKGEFALYLRSLWLISPRVNKSSSRIIPIPAAAPSVYSHDKAHFADTLPGCGSESPPPAAVLPPLPLFPEFGHGHWGVLSITGPDKQHLGYFGKLPNPSTRRTHGLCQDIANAVRVYFAPGESMHRLQCQVFVSGYDQAPQLRWTYVGLKWWGMEEGT